METINKPDVAQQTCFPAVASPVTTQKLGTHLDSINASIASPKAKRRTPEQDLIDEFIGHLNVHVDDDLKIHTLFNTDCKSKTLADIEFKSVSNIHWVIEAKSNDSADRHNTVHKIFGELLKETGRKGRVDFRHAILIPLESVKFYSRAFQSIKREKYIGFGNLIPIDTVFMSSIEGISQLSWAALYDAYRKN
ncbi:hypothetical protein [Pseudomonas siliginis]|uniref:hypothetical protein n=1 Tax=Pseudomonas siliginis TaxID=2842346 RepID=UPI002092CBC1|nr:hypothetical protein [Pseudomonas siliginis]UST82143.1 hypothetical protein NF676_12740 [Pseudomonas siliginis]